MSVKKILFHSFLLAFVVSFFTIIIVFPETKSIVYTNIEGKMFTLSWTFLLKVFFVLFWQTSILGSIFYMIAKKMFIK